MSVEAGLGELYELNDGHRSSNELSTASPAEPVARPVPEAPVIPGLVRPERPVRPAAVHPVADESFSELLTELSAEQPRIATVAPTPAPEPEPVPEAVAEKEAVPQVEELPATVAGSVMSADIIAKPARRLRVLRR